MGWALTARPCPKVLKCGPPHHVPGSRELLPSWYPDIYGKSAQTEDIVLHNLLAVFKVVLMFRIHLIYIVYLPLGCIPCVVYVPLD